MEFLLDQQLNLPTAGEVRQGWVVKHRNNEILIDIGAKSEGVIPSQEVETLDATARELLAVGNEVTVFVVEPEDQNGNIILSFARAAQEQDWIIAQKLLQSQEIYKGPVVGYNKGGLLVKLGQIRGFIPNSQISLDRFPDRNITLEKLQKLVGKQLTVKVVEVNRERNRLIMSEKAASKEIREARRTELLADLKEGDVLEGQVVNLTDYGAFVNIGGVEGLIHLSEMSWKRVKAPADVVQVGDKVKVAVINVDRDQQRVALSLKRVEGDPWSSIDKLYAEGQLIEATITKLTKFGAFARLNDDYQLEGLIHISELSENHVNHPRDVVKPADVITVRIIRISPDQRQLGLSIRQVSSAKYLEADMALMSAN